MYQLESKPGQARRLHLDPRATPPNCFPGNTGTAAHVLTFILVCSVSVWRWPSPCPALFSALLCFASSRQPPCPCWCPCLSERGKANANAGARALNCPWNSQPASQPPPCTITNPRQTRPNQPRHHTRQGRPRKTEEEPPWATKNLPTASSSSLPPLWLRSSFALAPNRSSKSSCVCRGIQTVVIRTPLLCLAVPASRDTICHFASFSLLLSLSPLLSLTLCFPHLSRCVSSPLFYPPRQTHRARHNRSRASSRAVSVSIIATPYASLPCVGSPSTQERLKGGKTEAKTSLEPWLRRCLLVQAIHPGLASIHQTPKNPRTSRHPLTQRLTTIICRVDFRLGLRRLGQTLLSGRLRARVSRQS
ncbi:hypothetical protein J3E68DRAFT_220360 [Trichoderma sp. SZMC 28012]